MQAKWYHQFKTFQMNTKKNGETVTSIPKGGVSHTVWPDHSKFEHPNKTVDEAMSAVKKWNSVKFYNNSATL